MRRLVLASLFVLGCGPDVQSIKDMGYMKYKPKMDPRGYPDLSLPDADLGESPDLESPECDDPHNQLDGIKHCGEGNGGT